jgi:hypothetical protein
MTARPRGRSTSSARRSIRLSWAAGRATWRRSAGPDGRRSASAHRSTEGSLVPARARRCEREAPGRLRREVGRREDDRLSGALVPHEVKALGLEREAHRQEAKRRGLPGRLRRGRTRPNTRSLCLRTFSPRPPLEAHQDAHGVGRERGVNPVPLHDGLNLLDFPFGKQIPEILRESVGERHCNGRASLSAQLRRHVRGHREERPGRCLEEGAPVRCRLRSS